jgi:hypothetical protein
MTFARAFNDWTRGDAGLGSVLSGVFALADKAPPEAMAEGAGDP